MKVLVLFSLLGVALSENESKPRNPNWANEETFGVHQKAEESFRASDEKMFHLLRLSTNNSPWSKDTTCVKVTAKETTGDAFNITVHFKKSGTPQASNSTVTLSKEYRYNDTKNGFTNVRQANTKTAYGLMFSNYEDCSIYYGKQGDFAPANGEGSYELWVVDGQQQKVPPCCDFMYKYLTLGMKTRDVYSNTCEDKAREEDQQQ
uniref:Lipocalin n=1 Tax=Rhipicephalus zambeziensis TaxID=60191 RepID=A0A224YHR5_9ACAR